MRREGRGTTAAGRSRGEEEGLLGGDVGRRIVFVLCAAVFFVMAFLRSEEVGAGHADEGRASAGPGPGWGDEPYLGIGHVVLRPVSAALVVNSFLRAVFGAILMLRFVRRVDKSVHVYRVAVTLAVITSTGAV